MVHMTAPKLTPWLRLAGTILALGSLALLAYLWVDSRSSRVEVGPCGLPALGFVTISPGGGVEYCILLPYGQRLEGQVWSDDQKVAILYVGVGEKQIPTSLYKGSAGFEVSATRLWKRSTLPETRSRSSTAIQSG